MDLHYEGTDTTLYIMCDLCSASFVMGNYLPVLRVVHRAHFVSNAPYFVPVSRDSVGHLRMYIRTEALEKPSFAPEKLTCTLQLKRVE